MSDEVVKEEGTAMYVHEVKYDTLTEILKKVTDVNKVFTYSMPNKAESYANNGFDLISVLNEYINGDEDWRISKETNVKLKSESNKIQIGDWVIQGSKIPSGAARWKDVPHGPESTLSGGKSPTSPRYRKIPAAEVPPT